MTEYHHGTIADKIIEMGKAKEFITIAIGMLENPRCDLDGAVGKYANDMDDIVRRAEHELNQEREGMIKYMPYEQCNRCELDHCCWSLGSFLEGDNKPNNCKQFIPKEKEE